MEAFTGVGITGGYGNTVPLAALEGSFNGSVDSVSAVMQPFGRCFRAEGERVRFTGSRSGGGAVEMQSQAVDGQVVRINATLSAAGDTLKAPTP